MTLFEYDDEIRAAHPVFCGVDEAGRGPLCGPVFAGCAVVHKKYYPKNVNDSKKLTEKSNKVSPCMAFPG